MFHNLIMKKFVLLAVLLNNELHYNFFCNNILVIIIVRHKTVPLQHKITSKLVLLNFLFDSFGYVLNFLTIFIYTECS